MPGGSYTGGIRVLGLWTEDVAYLCLKSVCRLSTKLPTKPRSLSSGVDPPPLEVEMESDRDDPDVVHIEPHLPTGFLAAVALFLLAFGAAIGGLLVMTVA